MNLDVTYHTPRFLAFTGYRITNRNHSEGTPDGLGLDKPHVSCLESCRKD